MTCAETAELCGFLGAAAALLSAACLAYPLFFLLRLRDAIETLEAPMPNADAKTIAIFLRAAADLRPEYRKKRRRPIAVAVVGIVLLAIAAIFMAAQGYCVL